MQAQKNRFRTRAIALILVWVLLLAISLMLLSVLLATLRENPQVQSVVSLSWVGYVVASNFADPQAYVIEVRATWVVPKVNVSAGDGYSSAWIGIGGQFDKSLIQVGTEHDALKGEEAYSAWYELLPDFAIKIPEIDLLAGDTVIASIALINSDINEWKIQITDVTNGQSFSKNVIYNSTRLSAEWIVERPTVNNQISRLSDFGSITFTDTYVNINHVTGTITSFPFSQVHMTNAQNTRLTSVSAISSDGSSFTVNFVAGG